MRVYEEKEVVKKEKVLKQIKCDNCKVGINEVSLDHYFEVTTQHSDWGNDSVDSVEDYDFCSYECMVSDMERYFASANRSEEYVIVRVKK